MAKAYTPGLKVSEHAVHRARRVLPTSGEVRVALGDRVQGSTVLAETFLEGEVTPMKVANLLACQPRDLSGLMLKKVGEAVAKDEVIARSKGVFGLMRTEAKAAAAGTVESVSAAYWMVIGFWDTLVPKLFAALVPAMVQAHVQPSLKPVDEVQWWSMALALVLGVMMLWRLAPRGGWIGAWPLAFIVGVTAGLKIVSHVESDLMAQGLATMESVVAVVPGAGGATDAAASVWSTLANLLVVVGVLSALT
jgi:hypothetical protein